MQVFNLTKNVIQQNIEDYTPGGHYFIVATREEFAPVSARLGVQAPAAVAPNGMDENVRFETYPSYDFLSFVYFELQGDAFVYEEFNLYYTQNFIALVAEKQDGLHQQFMQDFTLENFQERPLLDNLPYIYYKFLNNAFSKMFDAMCSYESTLADIEMDIITQNKNFEFDRIVTIKSNTFRVKKCLRLLLYVGDQILVNDNGLLPENSMRYFRNLDMRINRMYEYSANIHEVAEHLMELYNSAVNAKTNDLINKLTIFTVFATPLTVLTGVYGMNFVNIPELQHQYGYFILLAVMGGILLTTYLILRKIKLL